MTEDNRPSVSLVSLGCMKNLVDSESFLGKLAQENYILHPDPFEADLLLINTCGFIKSARDEGYETIKYYAKERKKRGLKGILVFGCMIEREGKKLFNKLKNINGFVGLSNYDIFKKACDKVMNDERFIITEKESKSFEDDERLVLTPGHYAYLRLSDGCDNCCTYCTIPIIRGPLHSKPMENLIEEANNLASLGTKELILISQDTTNYGRDLYGKSKLVELVKELEKIDGIVWIRLLYTHPAHWSDELISQMANSEKLIPYIDVPLQHSENNILDRMNRKISRKNIEELLDKLRQKIPNIVVRTTFIVGFPGETDEDFSELLKFVKNQEFDHVGVFTYSYEKDTISGDMDNQVNEKVKEKRLDKLMKVQQEIVFKKNKCLPDNIYNVIIDYLSESGYWVARSFREAPDVDNVIFVKADDVNPGNMLDVRIVGSEGYDLIAEKLEPGE